MMSRWLKGASRQTNGDAHTTTSTPMQAPKTSPNMSRKRRLSQHDDSDSDEIQLASQISPGSRLPLVDLPPSESNNKRIRVLKEVAIPVLDPKAAYPSPTPKSPHAHQTPTTSSSVPIFEASEAVPTRLRSTASTRSPRSVRPNEASHTTPSRAHQVHAQSSPGPTFEVLAVVPTRQRSAAGRCARASNYLKESSEDELVKAATVPSKKPARKPPVTKDASDFEADDMTSLSKEDLDLDDVSDSDSGPASSDTGVRPVEKAKVKAKAPAAKSGKGNRNAKTGSSEKSTAKNMTSIISRTKGIDRSRPPLHDIHDIFRDITIKATELGFKDVVDHFNGRQLRVATMCSGTESPILALSMVQNMLKEMDMEFSINHLFSAEIKPYKQAYIERNFAPPVIFRDITELINMTSNSEPAATTAYGAKAAIPDGIDMLVAGTSCVDYSNLNKSKKGIDDGGESGSTFSAVLSFSKEARPALIVIENVFGAPWDAMMARYEAIDYDVVGVRLDSRDFYIPQTRRRGYMVCFDRRRMDKDSHSSIRKKFCAFMEDFRRPTSSPVSAFLLPHDHYASRESSALMDGPKTEVDWGKCYIRHVEHREAMQIGKSYPYSLLQEGGLVVPPEHGAINWMNGQVERVQEYTDIAMLRKLAPLNEVLLYDARFKQRFWDVSQNVHMDADAVAFGITGCLTPTGMPFISDLARPIKPEEALALQGIPMDRISSTTESPAEIRDLAGNAMTTTVVGPVMLAALIAGFKLLKLFDNDSVIINKSSAAASIDERPTQVRSVVTSGHEVVELKWLLVEADRTVRRCSCEGNIGIAKNDIQQCQSCRHTTCLSCGGNPEHHYQVEKSLSQDRSSPTNFLDLLSTNLPLRLQPPSIRKLTSLASAAADPTGLTRRFYTLLETGMSETFGLQRSRRSSSWVVIYKSELSDSRLELKLDHDKPEWFFHLAAPPTLPLDDPLRELLVSPVARALAQTTLSELEWQWRDPMTTEHSVNIEASGPQVPSIWARNQIPRYEDHSQPQFLTIAPIPKTSNLDITGLYELLPRCGTSFDSLYRRTTTTNEAPLYLFHDPAPIGPVELDSFVFSATHGRLHEKETRIVNAWVDPSWKPWDANSKAVPVSAYEWSAHDTSPLQPVTTALECWRTEDHFSAASCDQIVVMSRLHIPTECASTSSLVTSHRWISDAVKRQLTLNAWKAYVPKEETASCSACTPPMPAPRWAYNSSTKSIERYEDPEAAAIYEQAVKRRPAPTQTIIQRHSPPASNELQLLLNLGTLAHQLRARLPLDAADMQYSVQYTNGSTNSEAFVFTPFHLQETRGVAPYQGKLDMTIDLHPKQGMSLAWMRMQEQGQRLTIEESQTEAFPDMDLQVEMRASTHVNIRGGILADHPGYGKTILSLALIQSQLGEASDITSELRLRQRSRAKGLIPSRATLVVCPVVLVSQWLEEAKTKLKNPGQVIAVKSTADLAKHTRADFEKASIIIISYRLLTSDSYIDRLAAFAGLPGPVGMAGRAFKDWLRLAISRVPVHLQILIQDGKKALSKHVRSRYADDINSETFKSWVPSRRLRGKDYVPGGKDKAKPESKPALKSLNTDTVGTPLFEMFYFNRVIFDEFPLMDAREFAATTTSLQADKVWGLSGTPPYGDFYEVAHMATLLGGTLPAGSTQRGIMKAKNARDYLKDMTTFEKFNAGLQVPSDSGYARIHELCQRFLDTFVRRDVISFADVTVEDHLVPVKLSVAHQALYAELSMHLNTQEMKMVKKRSKDSEPTDRMLRQFSAAASSETAEEALSKSAVFPPRRDLEKGIDGLAALIERRRLETEEVLEQCATAIPEAIQEEAAPFAAWRTKKIDRKEIGDKEVATSLGNLCTDESSGECKKAVSKKRNIESDEEDSQHAQDTSEVRHTDKVEKLAKRLLISTRSLRFVENVQRVREAATAREAAAHCSESDCTFTTGDNVAVSGHCGHVICKTSYLAMKHQGLYTCPASGCAADIRDHHLLWRSKMAALETDDSPHGAKLEAAVKIIQDIRDNGEQAILFIQYDNQFDEARAALEAYNIPAAMIDIRAGAGRIEDFKKDKQPVIVLNASSETAAGLNLQNANHVVFLSPLLRDQKYVYDATMAQALGRVLRHGQKKNIHVYRIVALDTIDVDVLEHREKRTDALVEMGAPSIEQPDAVKGLEVEKEAKPERTQLVRGKDGIFSLQPQSWLMCCGKERDREGEFVARTVARGRQRVLGWEDFSSLVKFSKVYTEDD